MDAVSSCLLSGVSGDLEAKRLSGCRNFVLYIPDIGLCAGCVPRTDPM